MPTFNTTDPKPGYVYDAAVDTWYPLLGIAPASQVDRWTKTAAGGETSLSGNDDNAVSLSYTSGTEQVYLNGVLLVRGQDYTASNGTTITGLTALAASDVAEVVTFNPSNIITTDAVLSTDFDAKGDLISASAASVPIRVPVGTNGYVLKANSATTSGLEWGALDDADAIQSSIVDAKGDIIAATAADTVARLAVGTNGQVLTAASGQATGLQWATPAAASRTYAIFSDTKANGVDGGTFTSGAYRTRDLQTTQVNNITSCSLASNQITLPAGTYFVIGRAPAFSVNRHNTRLQNISDSTTTILGAAAYAASAAGWSDSFFMGQFTIASSKVFEVQHYSSATKADEGFGSQVFSGGDNVYTNIIIEKIG